jgi:hypothetical protein
MPSYVQRYQQYREATRSWHQEARTIWSELVSHGAAVRNHPLYQDATAFARTVMTRARHNVELLVSRLQELEYRFAEPDNIWTVPGPDTVELLDRLEQQYGPLPIVLRAWFEVVGSVNLMGAHPKLSGYADLDWDGSEQRDGDPLVVETVVFGGGELSSYEALFEVPFAPDASLKAGESGSGSLIMLAPNPAFDAPIIDPGQRWTGTFFIPYLQTYFEWGGFPGLRGGWFPGQSSDAAFSQAEIDYLKQDLLPLL